MQLLELPFLFACNLSISYLLLQSLNFLLGIYPLEVHFILSSVDELIFCLFLLSKTLHAELFHAGGAEGGKGGWGGNNVEQIELYLPFGYLYAIDLCCHSHR